MLYFSLDFSSSSYKINIYARTKPLPGRVLHTPESDRRDSIFLRGKLKKQMENAIRDKSLPPEERARILENYRKIFGQS
ncbi:MAG: hypothetical protein NZM02_00120 [Patescibacteria group bacterium]|nr:hypothetical protein [Patescibacteria group bacterium]